MMNGKNTLKTVYSFCLIGAVLCFVCAVNSSSCSAQGYYSGDSSNYPGYSSSGYNSVPLNPPTLPYTSVDELRFLYNTGTHTPEYEAKMMKYFEDLEQYEKMCRSRQDAFKETPQQMASYYDEEDEVSVYRQAGREMGAWLIFIFLFVVIPFGVWFLFGKKKK